MYFLKHIALTSLWMLVALFVLSGCQKEKFELEEPRQEEVIATGSELFGYFEQITFNDGSYDDVLDNNSAVSLKLPVEVALNDERMILADKQDIQELENLLDTYDENEKLALFYPLTVVFADYSELLVQDETELSELENELVADIINCVDFSFPLSFSIYDPVNQHSDIVEVAHDQELYQFLDELSDETIVALQFPVTLIHGDGTEEETLNQEQLQLALEDVKDTCAEDQQEDEEDEENEEDDLQKRLQELIAILKEDDWSITKYQRGINMTGLFDAYRLSFLNDEEIYVERKHKDFTGRWEAKISGEQLILELEFNKGFFKVLKEDWQIISFDQNRIELKNEPKGRDRIKSLVLEKN